jgi:hypothetical protein
VPVVVQVVVPVVVQVVVEIAVPGDRLVDVRDAAIGSTR